MAAAKALAPPTAAPAAPDITRLERVLSAGGVFANAFERVLRAGESSDPTLRKMFSFCRADGRETQTFGLFGLFGELVFEPAEPIEPWELLGPRTRGLMLDWAVVATVVASFCW
jgi:hypothetical protein